MAKQTTSALTRKHKIGYGLGDAGACMTFTIVMMFATRYYVNVLKLDTVALATILLIWNIWDAINDPLMGALMDKTFAKNRNPKGKFRPWLLRSTPLLAVTCIVFFIVPTFFEGTALLVVLFFSKIAYEAAYTMFNIPMGSLLSAMAKNDEERAQLASARGIGSQISQLVPAMVGPIILSILGDSNPTAYAVVAIVFSAIGFVMCLLHYKWTEERVITTEPTQVGDQIKVTDILNVFKVNRAFVALCVHSIFFMLQGTILSTLGSYMYSDVMGDIGWMSAESLIVMPITFLFLGLAPKLARKMGLTVLIRRSLMISIVLMVALFALHMTMDVPVILHMVINATAAAFAAISTAQQYGLVGEAIDYNEYLTGKRTEGSIYGTFSLSRRVGTTLAQSLAALMLGWIGYDATLTVQTSATLTGIKALCLLVPAACLLGSWFAFRVIWNITPEIREKMHAHFEAKKASAE